jgi:hypothetical protein
MGWALGIGQGPGTESPIGPCRPCDHDIAANTLMPVKLHHPAAGVRASSA